MLGFLRQRVEQWGGVAGVQLLDTVIANNLRRAGAA
jgi:hypothetical protein